MGGLLDEADAVREGGNWTSGYQIDSLGCALRSDYTDICTPVRVPLSGPDAEDAGGTANDANIFAVVASLEGRVRCASGSEPDIVKDALDVETEKAAGVALWGDSVPNDVSFAGTDVLTVAAGANARETVAALLVAFWARATGVEHKDTIIHLGVGRLLEMFAEIDGSVLKNLGIRVATSPGYPADGIAISGPIKIKIGPDEVESTVNTLNNTGLSEANRLVAIEFDPCIAVRVA